MDNTLVANTWTAPSAITCLSTLLSKATSISLFRKPSRPAESLSAFERISPEILLTICDVLDMPTQVLLGLTCRRFYSIIARLLDPKLYTTEENIDISRCLEIDCPRFLACQRCGRFFRWRRRARISFSCPAHHEADRLDYVLPKTVAVTARPTISINPETVKLIARYYERGPRTGVSTGWLNHRGKTWSDIPQETKARWIGGQLVVRTQWSVEPEVMRKTNGQVWNQLKICAHDYKYWRTILEHKDTPQRCPYCACDVEASETTLADGSAMLIIRSWCNYGNSRSENLSVQQHFRSCGIARTNEDTIAPRDLRELFDSGEDEVIDKGTQELRNRIEEDERHIRELVCAPQ